MSSSVTQPASTHERKSTWVAIVIVVISVIVIGVLVAQSRIFDGVIGGASSTGKDKETTTTTTNPDGSVTTKRVSPDGKTTKTRGASVD